MTLVLEGDAGALSPVFQSMPPRSVEMIFTPGRLILRNRLNQQVSFALFFAKTSLMKEIGLVAAAVRLAREITEKEE